MRVRRAWPRELEECSTLDHCYTTDRVWQMETRVENGALVIGFRVARLPREIQVDYPRRGEDLQEGWQRCDGFLVAKEGRGVCGYVTLTAQAEHGIAWVDDLVVDRPLRRSGIGTALLRGAARWGRDHRLGRMVVGVQTKNHPAIRFCLSRGLAFCGYNDHYWSSQDIALFFGQSLR